MSLTNLKLRTKLLLGFGLTIVLVAIVTFIGTSRIDLLNDNGKPDCSGANASDEHVL